jgi:uncharacterized protein
MQIMREYDCEDDFFMRKTTLPPAPTDLPLTQSQRDALEAAAFRRLVLHLRQRSDVQNIDLMGYTGFCRNCLGDWLLEEAQDLGLEVSKEAARAHVYGMGTSEFKARYQTPATQEQMQRMEDSLAINEQVRGNKQVRGA